MKRALLALLFLTFSAVSARAQFTSVTATPVKDPNGAPYVNCRGNGAFVPSPSTTQVPLLSGSTFQTDVSISQCDSFGNMTITLADNNAITDGHSGSDVSKWRLNISSQDGKTNFSCTLTVTGTTQDATAAIQACAAPLPPAGGGGGNFVVKPISCATNMVFTMAGVPPNTSNTAFTVNLNCNVTSSSVVGPSGGTIQQGAVSQFTLIQNNVGGFAFPWPSNFIDQPTIQGAANATTNASFWYDGTNWHAQTFPASGGVAANAAGILGNVQRNNGAGGLAVAGINDNGTTVRVNEDISFKGPNPYSDIMAYGGYSNASPPSTTASTTNGSAAVTLAAALDFQDATKFPGTSIGNGIVIYKAGAVTGLHTPPAPTVAPFGKTGGATTYTYAFVAEDESGGLTAASSTGQTTTGQSALGIVTTNLTSAVWNNTLNGEQVYLCSSNCNLSLNAAVTINGFANGHFNGNYTIIALPDATHFTVYSPATPLVQSESASATVKVLAVNILTMPSLSVPNTVETGTSDRVMRWWVYRNGTLAFVVPGRDPYYEDAGVNTPGGIIPSYVPSTPGAAVNKYLATTIVSGAGTPNIVVTNAAGATVSGQTVLHDNSKNYLAVLAASRFGTPVYISQYNLPFNAATVLTNSVASATHTKFIDLNLNQPFVIKSGGIQIEGLLNHTPAFQNMAVVTGNALPLVLYPGTPGQQGFTFHNVSFQANQLTQPSFVWEAEQSSFGLMFDNVSFGASSSASNLNTSAVIFKGITESNIGFADNRNSCSVPQISLGPVCMRFTTVSTAIQTSQVASAGNILVQGFEFIGGGTSIQVDSLPFANSGGNSSNVAGPTQIYIEHSLREQGFGPFLRVITPNGTGSFWIKNWDDDASSASPGNAVIDAAYTTNGAAQYDVQDTVSSVSGQVVLAGAGNLNVRNSAFAAGGTLSTITPIGGVLSSSGGAVAVSGAGFGLTASDISQIGYLASTSPTPTATLGGAGSCSSNCA